MYVLIPTDRLTSQAGEKRGRKGDEKAEVDDEEEDEEEEKQGNFFNIHSGMHEDAGNETQREWRS